MFVLFVKFRLQTVKLSESFVSFSRRWYLPSGDRVRTSSSSFSVGWSFMREAVCWQSGAGSGLGSSQHRSGLIISHFGCQRRTNSPGWIGSQRCHWWTPGFPESCDGWHAAAQLLLRITAEVSVEEVHTLDSCLLRFFSSAAAAYFTELSPEMENSTEEAWLSVLYSKALPWYSLTFQIHSFIYLWLLILVNILYIKIVFQKTLWIIQ